MGIGKLLHALHVSHAKPIAPEGPAPIADALTPLKTGLKREQLVAIDHYIVDHLQEWSTLTQPKLVKGEDSGLKRTLHVHPDGQIAIWLRQRKGKGGQREVKSAATVHVHDGVIDVDKVVKLVAHPKNELQDDEIEREHEAFERTARRPHIVHALEIDEMVSHGARKVVVLEHEATGGDLLRFLEAHRGGKSLPAGARRQIMLDCLEGLAGLHEEELLHRDLKPENILIDIVDGGLSASIGDLGSCVSIDDEDERRELCGTIPYFSPELAAGMLARKKDRSLPKPLRTEADDLFALGMVFFVLEFGRMPAWFGDGEETLEHQLKERVRVTTAMMQKDGVVDGGPGTRLGVIARLLSLDPRERGSARELFDELSRAS